ncbi:MAG: CusA/CzcA family heavy metal efflux RND transporter [Citrobacter freundii]|nr:MAG: CusA/CzcA family heavy metal efflux RND transporter [Citrobacter freundii]
MLNKIIDFSIKNKLIIGLMTLGLIIWGVYSLKKIPIDAVPDITNNQVQIITLSPSLGAEEVERLITFPIEQTMSVIPKLDEVRSMSRFGLSVVTVIFKDGVDIYWARQQVDEKLGEAKTNIPDGIGNPEMAPISTGLGEIYQYTLYAKKGFESKYSAMELRSIQDWIVRRQLLGTPGIAEVNSFGGLLKQYEISLSPDKLRSYNLSISDIFSALEKNNQNTGGAYIDKKPNAYFIRSEGLVSNVDDIEKIVVKNSGGIPVLIRDVAKVNISSAVRYGALTRNGKEAVGGIVMMLKGENSSQVVGLVKDKMTQITKSLPEGVAVEAFLDRSALVGRAIDTVKKNLLEGAIIVIFVLVIFLGNFRAGFVVASVIPLAMLFAISMMNIFGVSGNLMSLGAIDFGLIVDGAVIIVEATLHHIATHKKPGVQVLSQKEMDHNVFESAKRMMSSAAFGQIIILIVYLPILALVGIEGKMFGPMAQTVAFAILGAFLLSLTYVPMMSSLLLNKKISDKLNFSDKMMNFFLRFYTPIIKGALKKRILVVVISVLLFIASLVVFLNLGGEFIPTLEEGDFAVETRLLTGSSLNQTIDKVNQASQLLTKKFPEVREVVGKIGSSEIPTDPMPMEACDLTILLKDKKEWVSAGSREELANKMAEELEKLPGVTFGFSQPVQLRMNELIAGVRQDVGIKIFGEDLTELSTLSEKIGKIVGSVNGAKDLYLEKVTGLPQIIVNINRDQLARYGLDIQTVNDAVNSAFAGKVAGIVYEGEKRYNLVVRLEEQNRQSIDDVKNIYITAPNGNQVPLMQLANVELRVGPNQIQREDTKRRIIVGFNVRGRDIASVVKEIQQKIEQQVKLPPGYFITYGGQFKNLEEASARLSIAVPLALGLILLLLFFTFGSLKQSILIFTAIPMAAIGGVFALVLRGMPFSISAGIGFIALFGVAVLNGIVLISEFNRLKASGLNDLREIVIRGTTIRLRPVLMTATVASLGFLPMALSSSSGAEVQKPLATVVIGGLVTSTILTLVVLPILYTFIDKMKMKKVKPAYIGGATILLLMMTLPQLVSAQQQGALSIQQSIDMGIQNNPAIRSAESQIQQQEFIRGASTDFGKTNLGIQYGQANSIKWDNNISVSQSIPNLGLFKANRLLGDARVQSSQLNLAVNKNDLVYQIKTAFYQLQYLLNLEKLLQVQDTVYGNFLRASAARFKAGETNLLEQKTAETQLNDVRNSLRRNSSDILIYRQQLQTLLNTTDSVSIALDTSFKLDYIPNFEISDSLHNPVSAFYKQQIAIAERQIGVEKAKGGIDFSLGYFSQSIIGFQNVDGAERYFGRGKRFQGVQAGISIPIFYKPFRYRIKAAAAEKQVAQSNFDLLRLNLNGQLRQAVQEYVKNEASISYYESSAVPNATLILRQAQTAFRNGEIGYLEFLQAVKTHADIRLGYLQAINQYNQSLIQIQYLEGNQ